MIAIGNEMSVRKRRSRGKQETLILPDFPTPPETSPHPLKHHTKSIFIYLQSFPRTYSHHVSKSTGGLGAPAAYAVEA